MDDSAEWAVDPPSFRDVMGRFPTGVAVVAARTSADEQLAMTVSSFTSVSLEPVLVLVCIEREVPMHAAILDAGQWAVSILGADQEHLSRLFAVRGSGSAELAKVPHSAGPVTGAAVLTGALATLECRTKAVHDGGDHSVLVAEVLSLAVTRERGGPLVFFRGGYRTLGE